MFYFQNSWIKSIIKLNDKQIIVLVVMGSLSINQAIMLNTITPILNPIIRFGQV